MRFETLGVLEREVRILPYLQICGRRVKRNSPGFQLGDGGAVPSFRSTMMRIRITRLQMRR